MAQRGAWKKIKQHEQIQQFLHKRHHIQHYGTTFFHKHLIYSLASYTTIGRAKNSPIVCSTIKDDLLLPKNQAIV
jgi:hypothetical protein